MDRSAYLCHHPRHSGLITLPKRTKNLDPSPHPHTGYLYLPNPFKTFKHNCMCLVFKRHHCVNLVRTLPATFMLRIYLSSWVFSKSKRSHVSHLDKSVSRRISSRHCFVSTTFPWIHRVLLTCLAYLIPTVPVQDGCPSLTHKPSIRPVLSFHSLRRRHFASEQCSPK